MLTLIKNNSTQRLAFSRGFSLIECIIVLTVLGILCSISLPNLFQLRTRDNRLEQEARELKHALQELHLKSLLSKSKLTLKLRSGGWYSAALMPAQHSLPQGMNILTGNESRVEIVFYGHGTTSPLQVKIMQGQRRCSVFLALRGRVRIECDR